VVLEVGDQTKVQLMTILPVAVMYKALVPTELVLMDKLDLDTAAAMAAAMEQGAEAGLVEQDKMVAIHLVVEAM
jgi:hypothetical protein